MPPEWFCEARWSSRMVLESTTLSKERCKNGPGTVSPWREASWGAAEGSEKLCQDHLFTIPGRGLHFPGPFGKRIELFKTIREACCAENRFLQTRVTQLVSKYRVVAMARACLQPLPGADLSPPPLPLPPAHHPGSSGVERLSTHPEDIRRVRKLAVELAFELGLFRVLLAARGAQGAAGRAHHEGAPHRNAPLVLRSLPAHKRRRDSARACANRALRRVAKNEWSKLRA